jgi:hypothetical protein
VPIILKGIRKITAHILKRGSIVWLRMVIPMPTTQRWHDAAQHIMIVEIFPPINWHDFMAGYEDAVAQTKATTHPTVIIVQSNDIPMTNEGNAFSQLQRMMRILPPTVRGLIPVLGKSRAFERTAATITATVMNRKNLQIATSLEEAITLAQDLLQKTA